MLTSKYLSADFTLPLAKRLKSDQISVSDKMVYSASLNVTHMDSPAQTLPFELLTMVFEFLDMQDIMAVAQTCKAWNDATYSKSIWRKINFRMHQDITVVSPFYKRTTSSSVNEGKQQDLILNENEGSFNMYLKKYTRNSDVLPKYDPRTCFWILSSSRTETKIRLTWPLPSLTFLKQSANINRFFNIESLDFSLVGDQISDSFMKSLLSVLPNLKRVNLNSCFKISNKTIHELVSHPTRRNSLQELTLKRCFNITNTSLFFISQYCNNLKLLDVSDGCAAVDRVGLLYLVFDMEVKAVHRKYHNYESSLFTNHFVYSDYDLSGLLSVKSSSEAARECLEANSNDYYYYHSSDFISSSLPNNNYNTAAGEISIPPVLKSLEVLRLASSDYVTNVTFEKFFDRLSTIGAHNCRLMEFDLSRNYNITDEGLQLIFSSHEKNTQLCKRSFLLNVRGCDLITKEAALSLEGRLKNIFGPGVSVVENCKIESHSEDSIKDFIRRNFM